MVNKNIETKSSEGAKRPAERLVMPYLFMENELMKPNYKSTQPYKLGKQYKKLGKMLMNEKTDLRDLVKMADSIGLKISIEIEEPSNCCDKYALSA